LYKNKFSQRTSNKLYNHKSQLQLFTVTVTGIVVLVVLHYKDNINGCENFTQMLRIKNTGVKNSPKVWFYLRKKTNCRHHVNERVIYDNAVFSYLLSLLLKANVKQR
jgi:hypothetical protein